MDFAALSDLIDIWQLSTFELFIAGRNKRGQLAVEGIASAFLMSYRGFFFIVTAEHALEATDSLEPYLMMRGARIEIKSLEFLRDKKSDVAVAIASETALGAVLDEFYVLPFDINEDVGMSFRDDPDESIYAVLGSPISKNFARFRRTKIEASREKLALVVEYLRDAKFKTPIPEALVFRYQPKKMVDAEDRNKGELPSLIGMSGGPALSIRRTISTAGETATLAHIAGVACCWRREHQAVVVAPASAVRRLADQAITDVLRCRNSANPH